MYRNGQKITVTPAEEPTDIIWENMHHSELRKAFGWAQGAAITLLFVAGIWYLLFRINVWKNQKEKEGDVLYYKYEFLIQNSVTILI